MINKLITLLAFVLLFGCKSERKIELHKAEILVDTRHSGEPNLFASVEGLLYLSWVEYINDSTDVLQFSQLEDGAWSAPKEITRGNDWFVNWADFPSLISASKKQMSAHWLQKSASGTYDYDVRISQSNDGGSTWTPSIIPHRDGVNAEHGFVSMLPTPEGKTFAVWLDGRNTKKDTLNAMTLRTAEIDKDGNLTSEVELDNRVCDCCQTGATWTDKGPIVVYRDRSENEVRDIGIVRKIEGKWTTPKTLFDDKWIIAGCPVNGPSIDSEGSKVVVAWFTMSEDSPKVFAAISNDYGASFDAPIRIDSSEAIGRVDVKINEGKIYVLWMESNNEEADINLKIIESSNQISPTFKIGKNSAARGSGFPRIDCLENDLFIGWTDATDSITIVRTFKIQLDEI